MSFKFAAGFTASILFLLYLSISNTRKKGKAKESGSSTMVVSGAIIGTLVGGSSTIGTAQLAYTYGFSAWWFTLGAGISCFLLAFVYTEPFRKKCNGTLTHLAKEAYGPKVGITATVFSTAGTYINIIAQLISASSIIIMVLPDLSMQVSILAAALLMILYAVSGGVEGLGKIGVYKTALLYITVIGGGMLAVYLFGGIKAVAECPIFLEGNYFSIFNRGIGKDLGSGISVVLGVLSTQTYAQAIMAAKSETCARKGAFISACLIPPIGIGGTLIGMYMRVHYPGLSETKFALPMFVQENVPPVFAGIIFATLLITVLGTGAGLAVGIGTVVKKDVLNGKTAFTEKKLILIVLVSAGTIASGGIGELILDFSFMSMGLRAAVLFIPLQFCFFGKGKVPSKFAFAAVVAGPATVLAGNAAGLPFDPLFLGVFVNLFLMLAGCGYQKWKISRE